MSKKLEYYGGQGYAYSSEIGKFEVRATETKYFTRLSEAVQYYECLEEDKALWDCSVLSTLLSCHTYETEIDKFIGIGFDSNGTTLRKSYSPYEYFFKGIMSKTKYNKLRPNVLIAETMEEYKKLVPEYQRQGYMVMNVILAD